MKIKQALSEARQNLNQALLQNPGLDASVLLAHALGMYSEVIYAHPEKELTAEQEQNFQSYIEQRLNHKPVAYIRGVKEFWSLDFEINSSVMIPRPETEILVQQALDCIKKSSNGGSRIFYVADLGTGSGNIAIALAYSNLNVKVYACDFSSEAVKVAQKNAQRLGVSEQIHFLVADMAEFLKEITKLLGEEGLFLILSNPPYIREADITNLDQGIIEFEPLSALNGGPDGLTYYKIILNAFAKNPDILTAGGYLIMELSEIISSLVRDLFDQTGLFQNIEIIKDYAGLDRVICAKKRTR